VKYSSERAEPLSTENVAVIRIRSKTIVLEMLRASMNSPSEILDLIGRILPEIQIYQSRFYKDYE